jgi:uncharacterized protein (TIGR00369 family)
MYDFDAHPPGYGLTPLAEATAMPGLDFLRAMMRGERPAPPISRTLRFLLTEAEEGRAVFQGEPTEAVLNPLGTVHGGWSATLLDSCMACAVHTTLAAGEAYTTLEFKVSCLRPLFPGMGLVRAEGAVVHRAKRVAAAEGRLLDKDGKLLATGTETCLIFDAATAQRSRS